MDVQIHAIRRLCHHRPQRLSQAQIPPLGRHGLVTPLPERVNRRSSCCISLCAIQKSRAQSVSLARAKQLSPDRDVVVLYQAPTGSCSCHTTHSPHHTRTQVPVPIKECIRNGLNERKGGGSVSRPTSKKSSVTRKRKTKSNTLKKHPKEAPSCSSSLGDQ